MSEAWASAPLSAVLEPVKRPVSVSTLGEVPFAGVRWYAEGVYPRVVEAAAKVKTKTLNRICTNDVVYNRMWATKAAFGVVASDSSGCLVTNDFPIFTTNEEALPDWIRLIFQGRHFQAKAAELSVGTTERRRLHESQFLSIPIPLPPLPVQRRIVDLMEHLDTQVNRLSDERRAALETRTALRRRLRSEKTIPLKILAGEDGIQIGPFGSQLHAHEYTPEGVPVVMPQDLVNGEIITAKIKRVPPEVANRLARHRLLPGDIVFPRRGDLSKRAMVADAQEGWLCGTGCIRFRPAAHEKAALLYEGLADQAVTDWLTENAVGTTMLNLNTTIVGNLPVPEMGGEAEQVADNAALADVLSRELATEIETLRAVRFCLLATLLLEHATVPDAYDELLGLAS